MGTSTNKGIRMSKSKQYTKGYNYSLHTGTLIRPSMVVLTNNLPYGKGRLEAQIFFFNGAIRVLITDGYKNLYDKSGFKGLKQALNISHGWMQNATHKTYSRME